MANMEYGEAKSPLCKIVTAQYRLEPLSDSKISLGESPYKGYYATNSCAKVRLKMLKRELNLRPPLS